jgi:nitrogen-specific signal transduction histidine kinase
MSNDEKNRDEESLEHVETASELNLNSNVEARIKNPLAGIPRAQLLRNVEIFAEEKQLTEELPILSKGAIRKSWLIGLLVCSHDSAKSCPKSGRFRNARRARR